MEHDDPKLIQSWLRAEDTAVRILFARYYPKAVRLARLSGLSEDEAQDCAQLTFLRAFEKRHQLRNPQAFPLWFQRIATSQIMEHFNKNDVRKTTSLEDGKLGEDLEVAQEDTPDGMMLTAERATQLNQALETLPPDARLALVLRYYEDLSFKEIAHVLNKREGTIRVLIHRALKQLRTYPSFRRMYAFA